MASALQCRLSKFYVIFAVRVKFLEYQKKILIVKPKNERLKVHINAKIMDIAIEHFLAQWRKKGTDIFFKG